MTTILKTQKFIASDLAECINAAGANSMSLPYLKDVILRWLRVNCAPEKLPKEKPKKTGKREQLKLGLDR